MSLPKISAGDDPVTTRNKINDGLAQFDDVQAQFDGVQGQLDDIRAQFDALNDRVTRSFIGLLLSLVQGNGPGLAPSAYAATAIGDAATLQPLDPSGVVSTNSGRAYRIVGAGLIAPIAPIGLDPDAIYVLTARYWRLTDVLDPNNNAIDIGIQWLDAGGNGVGTTLIRRDLNLQIQGGSRSLSLRVPSTARDRAAIRPPDGAVAWRPFIKTYGADGATAVDRLTVTNVTFAGAYAPDLSDLAGRIGTIEGQLSSGLPLSAPILPSYVVADLPRPGNRGRKAFASDGRAPDAVGNLEAANAGTGVEVTDNGSKWVISGTNQQVQA
jgi:hypothetical protein